MTNRPHQCYDDNQILIIDLNKILIQYMSWNKLTVLFWCWQCVYWQCLTVFNLVKYCYFRPAFAQFEAENNHPSNSRLCDLDPRLNDCYGNNLLAKCNNHTNLKKKWSMFFLAFCRNIFQHIASRGDLWFLLQITP